MLAFLAENWIGISGLLLAFWGAWTGFRVRSLDEPASCQQLRAGLSESRGAAWYGRGLAWLLDRADVVFGRPRRAGVGILVCVAIAIAYGVIFFLGSWTLGGSGLLGEHAALPNEWRVFPERWGLAVAFAALVTLLVLTSQWRERIDLWGEARLGAAVGGFWLVSRGVV